MFLCFYLLFICPSNCIRLFLFINRAFMYRSYTSDTICSFHPSFVEIACSNAYVIITFAVHTANINVSTLFIQQILMIVFCSYSRSFTNPLKSRRAGPRPYVQLPQYNTTRLLCTIYPQPCLLVATPRNVLSRQNRLVCKHATKLQAVLWY